MLSIRKHLPILSTVIALCILACAAAYWYLLVLPEIVPSIPLPKGATRIDHRDWATSEVLWYRDTFVVNLTPQEVESFYKNALAWCGQWFRGWVDRENFHASCAGDARPTGWYDLEIASDNGTAGSQTVIVVEVGWEAGP